MSSSSIVTRGGAQKSKIQTRGMIKAVENRKPSAALLEAKKKAKLKMNRKSTEEVVVKDIFQNAMNAAYMVRGDTGLIYDDEMTKHYCPWDENYPEKPERITCIYERCQELKLIDRCYRIPSRSATKDEILLKHTEEHYERLKATSEMKDNNQLEELSSNYDAIYMNSRTFDVSLLASGSTIQLVNHIVTGKVQNGMAIIRPPGHHAMKSEYNGYSFFNNVAIAVQHCLTNLKLSRILIVDWDVHHGQGVQRMFYDDPRVLYFSIHRYEHGTFWPNLRESDFDYIGEGHGKGYNFNLPLNSTGMKNSDYMAIFNQILMPVAVEFQPELVLISAGYDAAYGCPEYKPDLVVVSAGFDSALGDSKGEMEVTPAFYPHLLTPLLSLAQGRVAVVLEGGYCLQSLAEGATLTLRTLLGDPCPKLEIFEEPCESIQESILNCIHAHRQYWKCLQLQKTYTLEEFNNVNPQPNMHKVIQCFKGDISKPTKYETRNCYPVQNNARLNEISDRLRQLKLATSLSFPAERVCYVYDDFMMEHKNVFEEGHPENPERIKKIRDRHEEYGLFARMKCLKPRHATTDELCLAHTRAHVNFVRRSVEKNELREIGDSYNSVYFHPKTFECATMAAGSVLQVVDNVLNGDARCGICIIRPPGHHAESDLPHGFCIFNNIAIAAQYAIRDHGLKRVCIIDWDVHHGNGTQHIFESNPNVLYISVHRYDHGAFFPKSKDADFDVVGSGSGTGFNVNIPWNKKGMGDIEYALTFQTVILPILYEFNPELVLVSAGFDAAIGDPLGGCKVSPEAYGHFTHWLSALAGGRVVVCLEGGYNVNSISYAMTMCSKALLGDPLPTLNVYNNKTGINSSCIETLQNVLSVQSKHWKNLKFNKKLPCYPNGLNSTSYLSIQFGNMNINKFSDNDNSKQNSKENRKSSLENGNNAEAGPSSSTERNKTLTEYLSENMEALAREEMFAVVPLNNCPHLSLLRPENCPEKIDTKAPCVECNSTVENWICLHCFKILCGRYVNEHMLLHRMEFDHPLTLSFSDLSVWCYACEAYIDNPCLFKYKNLAHLDKFGEELVWSYGNISIDLEDQSNN